MNDMLAQYLVSLGIPVNLAQQMTMGGNSGFHLPQQQAAVATPVPGATPYQLPPNLYPQQKGGGSQSGIGSAVSSMMGGGSGGASSTPSWGYTGGADSVGYGGSMTF